MMKGNNSNSNGDKDKDNDNYEDNDSSLNFDDWIGTKKQNRYGKKRLDDSTSTCPTVCMEDSTSSSSFLEGSESSVKYIQKLVEGDDEYECEEEEEEDDDDDDEEEEEEEEEQQGNYSATNNDFNNSMNSMNFTQRRRSKTRAVARKEIQSLSMSVKCLPRELEMEKVEKIVARKEIQSLSTSVKCLPRTLEMKKVEKKRGKN